MILRKWHVVACCLSVTLLTINFKSAGSLLDKSIHTYAYGVVSWFSCTLCFVFFRRFFSGESKFFAYLSEASYSVYLFHHILVVILGISLVGLNVSIHLKYLVIVGVVISAVLVLHDRLILRYKLLRYLLGFQHCTRYNYEKGRGYDKQKSIDIVLHYFLFIRSLYQNSIFPVDPG